MYGCVCLIHTSSISDSNIIVLDWGAYKCVCVCVCVCNTHVLVLQVKYNIPRLGVLTSLYMCVCVCVCVLVYTGTCSSTYIMLRIVHNFKERAYLAKVTWWKIAIILRLAFTLANFAWNFAMFQKNRTPASSFFWRCFEGVLAWLLSNLHRNVAIFSKQV